MPELLNTVNSLDDRFNQYEFVTLTSGEWKAIRKELVEGQKPPSNTGSPKLPPFSQVWDELSCCCDDKKIVQLVYITIERQLRTGARDR